MTASFVMTMRYLIAQLTAMRYWLRCVFVAQYVKRQEYGDQCNAEEQNSAEWHWSHDELFSSGGRLWGRRGLHCHWDNARWTTKCTGSPSLCSYYTSTTTNYHDDYC